MVLLRLSSFQNFCVIWTGGAVKLGFIGTGVIGRYLRTDLMGRGISSTVLSELNFDDRIESVYHEIFAYYYSPYFGQG